MGTMAYTTSAGRINKFKGEILAHAQPVECLGITGQNKKIPKMNGDTAVYRRFIPYGATSSTANTQNRPSVTASAHLVTEGVTPAADTITPVDVTVQLQQYAVLYAVTDKTVDMYEDDIPGEMKQQTGERIGLLREMIRYGQLKGATNAFYAGGTSRSTVAAVVSYNLLAKVTRNLALNHAKMVTKILAPSANVNTSPVQPGYLVFCSTDVEHDVKQLPDFIHVAEYGTRKTVHDNEIGASGRYRFIVSPELTGYADAGSAVAGTSLNSTTGTSADVYPIIVVAEDAWGDVALRGKDSIDPTWLPPGEKDKNDPLGQRGYIGGKFYSAAVLLNQGWMAVVEVAITNLG
jgi:N4-gp56 family major capsid protein